ncbi:PHP domain-containing protein [Maledivibacter halophilus]|uniref:DUF3604 domain-containing protein n=1 Tax=Maledivibacter halophilus TaxID=36842 RepID=A0A1T5M465_9FIRM|nr:DUF3604 domain-containing protein [Maledivibacter halophilus]SKC83051.1 Protein of unknown function [Maledivibacter halophilus]
MARYNIYWTDMHSNIHSNQMKDLKQWYDQAKKLFDFWPIAYYPYYMRKDDTGLGVEDIYPKDVVENDWKTLKDFVESNSSDDFPVFMGYEWQGSGLDGDHNVFYLNNNEQLYSPLRYEELIQKLPRGEAIAIPHHLAYQIGKRGKNWATHNDEYSPFVEIYSSHGSSESDMTHLHMNRHIHMGPRTGGCTVEDGLNKGNIFGIIASGDNHSVPGVYGHGLMACMATECTKEALWDAFLNRRVYGVTGDRIKLDFEINNSPMGSIVKNSEELQAQVNAVGSHAIDRIELLRNNVLAYVHTNSGSWEEKELPQKVRFKFRVEFGWGPDRRIYEDIYKKIWDCSLKVKGEIISVEKCWTNYGQEILNTSKDQCDFKLTSYKSSATGKWMGPSPVENESLIFEIEAPVESAVELIVDKKMYSLPIKDILSTTQLFHLRDEVKELTDKRWGFKDYYRDDPFWHNAYKFKVYQGIPYEGYKTGFKYKIPYRKDCKDNYRVRVYQKNGQMAWSSPIFIR